MHLDPAFPLISGAALALVLLGVLLRRLRQPAEVGYLLAGVVLGPFCLSLFPDASAVERLGGIGVVLLLFFVGLEMSASALAECWKVAVFGTLLQILGSVALVALVGVPLDWPMSRVLLIGFALSLSSTAVVIKLLRESADPHGQVARRVTAILIAQDLAIVPMLVILQRFGGDEVSTGQVVRQAVGGLAFLVAAAMIARRRRFDLPGARWLAGNPETQVFAALGLCFGLALLTGLLDLSTASGAFLAGMLVRAAEQTRWVERSLRPFEVVFVAAFFLSVGMLIDLEFLAHEWRVVLLLLAIVFITNTGLNAAVLRLFGSSWRDSFRAGALLSQIGEMSFLLVAVGFGAGIVADYSYQLLLCTISLSLLVCPAWISLMERMVGKPRPAPAPAPTSTSTQARGRPGSEGAPEEHRNPQSR